MKAIHAELRYHDVKEKVTDLVTQIAQFEQRFKRVEEFIDQWKDVPRERKP